MAAKNKKDFDREYIFNLIMPTDSASAPPPPPEEEPQQSAVSEPQIRDSLSLLRDRINQPASPVSSIHLKPVRELVVVNLMEHLVTERLDSAFDKFNCCRCDKCRRDVLALALNSLPPQYVVAEPQTLPALLEECSTKEVSAALVKAIIQIKSHPQH